MAGELDDGLRSQRVLVLSCRIDLESGGLPLRDLSRKVTCHSQICM